MKNEKIGSERKSWNLFLILGLFLCVAFGIAALTYSWLTDSASAVPLTAESSSVTGAYIDDFAYDFEYSFTGSNNDWHSASGDAMGGILVDYSNSSATNYIENLRFRVTQHGSIKSRARVKFAYQWFNTQTLPTAHANDEPSTVRNALQGPSITLTPTVTNDWTLGQDDYYYYQDSTTSSYVITDGQQISICTGFSSVSVPAEYTGQLRIIALFDGVQFNRYREVWELTSAQSNG